MKKHRPRFRMRYDKTFGIMLLSPWLLGLLLFKLLPILASFGLSFTDFYLIEPKKTSFIGLENYTRLLQDEAIGFLIAATIGTVIRIIPLQIIASIFLAALLSSPRLKAATAVRTLFFLPSITPAIFFSLVINLIAIFGGVILLDRGNIFRGSNSPFDGYISYWLFDKWQLGYAAGLAWVFFALVMIIIITLFSSSRRWVYYPDSED